MRRLLALGGVLATLAACGVDGAPRPPAPAPRTPGATVSVQADMGMRTDAL